MAAGYQRLAQYASRTPGSSLISFIKAQSQRAIFATKSAYVLPMKRILLMLALVPFASAAVSAPPIEGRWHSPHGSVVVSVTPCGGGAWCGTVVRASDKVEGDARKGGYANIVGSRLLTGLKPAGGGAYQGRVYLPKHRITVSATVRSAGPNIMIVKGCAVPGVLCKEQRWTRVT